jgi:tRNA uridine 5-carboxymethylaminomethyl modification enzyme
MFHVEHRTAMETYDVIVVGGGHAGNEAAAAAANMGARTLMVTMNMQTIGQMSCNPAMGGIAKGQIVREVDALGGYSGIVSDRSTIQFRMLNRRKGEAMWSPRTQNDRMRFAEEYRLMLERTPLLDFWQDMVQELIIENDTVKGVRTSLGVDIHARAVILTSGTFMNGLIHVGEKQLGGGRMGEKASTGITAQLEGLGFLAGRMKTGTPPRIDGRSINYATLEVQPGDEEPGRFSYLDTPPLQQQMPCYITYTTPEIHNLLRDNLLKSPMYNGTIHSQGPRYCPSIEDKVVRFAEKERHQLFVEPEGWHTCEVYLNGFSSSLPEEVQYKALRMIPGFENAKMFRPGYAIEYDYFPPHQLKLSLETQRIHGLFFAGQINGTTGYEEAACQGIMAGINAVHYTRDQQPIVLRRDQAYIGVLIDDLINKSTDEPYRMFTSRAEHRLHLRQDNADERLTELGHSIGLATPERFSRWQHKHSNIAIVRNTLDTVGIEPEEINGVLEGLGTSPITQRTKASKLLTRPGLEYEHLLAAKPELQASLFSIDADCTQQAVLQVKYAGYIDKEQELVIKMKRLEEVIIPDAFDFLAITALSKEARQKLTAIKPRTLGQASRISGVKPTDVQVLMVYMGR